MSTKKYVSLDKLTKYNELLQAKMSAADAQVLADAKAWAESLSTNYEAAGTVASAKEELQGSINSLANGAVAQNTAALATLNGDANTTGSVAKAVADSASTLQASIDAVGDIAEQNATDIDTLESKVDALEKGTYNDSEVRGLIAGNTEAIGTLGQTHATDKKTLEDAIALKADQTALEAVSGVANAAVKQSDYNIKVAALEAEDARIAGLVATETQRATEVESGLDERLVEVEAFFKLAEGEQLDTALDTLVEIQRFVTSEGSAADQMVLDIAANAKAIEDEAAARANADTTLQQNIDKKADTSVVEAIDGRVEELETASATHATKSEVEAVSTALTEYQNAHASDYTNTQIDNAISGAVSAETERVNTELDKKVDKVSGKGLSTNDLTNELKGQYDAAYTHSQSAHAPVDAQANVIESVKVNGTALTVTGKAVDITVPTKVSELTNDVPYLVVADITGKADKATTLAGYGITDAYTSAQTDSAIATAMNSFVEVSDEEINQLFA